MEPLARTRSSNFGRVLAEIKTNNELLRVYLTDFPQNIRENKPGWYSSAIIELLFVLNTYFIKALCHKDKDLASD